MKNAVFLAAMYLRLSREDRGDGYENKNTDYLSVQSNSIINQRELIRNYILEQDDIKLYDIYADDGFSGSNFDRPEFKRMMGDIEAGNVNCVIVKDLSRFGRDYIETGRYIQKVFPDLGVRFIAITDNYDSFHTDSEESAIVLPVKNFINDSYCRDISAKVKSQLEVKRKKGECIAPFALYGYKKSPYNKNKLIIDEYAAQTVRQIFEWKIQGMAVFAIADKLNESGVLSPREYKKSNGSNYNGGFYGSSKSKWSSSTVKRILTNETYLGHLVQGKTQKINYKLKKSIQKPEKEWVRVENTHEAIVSENDFRIVQSLLKTGSRISPETEKINFFAGILFCGDCGRQLIRRENRYKNNVRLYYICSLKNSGQGCTRHSIEEESLKALVRIVIQKYIDLFCQELRKKSFGTYVYDKCYKKEAERMGEQSDKYNALYYGLYEDLKRGIIDEEEFIRLRQEFKYKAKEYDKAQKKHVELAEKLRHSTEIETDRYALCIMVSKIKVYENRRIEIDFSFCDCYRRSIRY